MQLRLYLFSHLILIILFGLCCAQKDKDETSKEKVNYDETIGYYFAEWTIQPTLYPASYPTDIPTYFPTPFVQNPGYINPASQIKQLATPAPTPFGMNPSFKTNMPTVEPTPIEWRFAKPTPFFFNPKYKTPDPTNYPTLFPTPYELNPLYVSKEPTVIPSVRPSEVPTPWPSPSIISNSIRCEDIHNKDGFVFENQINKDYISSLQGLTVIYHKTYKVINVLNSDKSMTTYILYLCDYPDQHVFDELGRVFARKIIRIPVTRVAFTSTYIEHILELLALRPAIKAAGSPLQWSSSSCLYRLAESGSLVEAFTWDTETPDNKRLTDADVAVTFGTEQEVANGLYNGVAIPSNWYNCTALQTATNLIAFISLFFNYEEQANSLIQQLKTNYKCSSETAKRNSNPVATRRVLWCDYGGKYGVGSGDSKNLIYSEDIWSCKTCPGIECSLVRDIGAKLLDYRDFGETTVEVNGVEYLESTEFMEMAVFADIWINSGSDYSDFNKTLTALMKGNAGNPHIGWLPLAEIPAVKSRRVYDMYKSGYNAGKQQVLAEPDAMLQDLYSVVSSANHKRIWLRNIFRETIPITSTAVSCTGNPWAAVPFQANSCQDLQGTPYPTILPGASPSTLFTSTNEKLKKSNSIFGPMLTKVFLSVVSIVVILAMGAYLWKVSFDSDTKEHIISLYRYREEKEDSPYGQKMATEQTTPNSKKRSHRLQRYTPAYGESEHAEDIDVEMTKFDDDAAGGAQELNKVKVFPSFPGRFTHAPTILKQDSGELGVDPALASELLAQKSNENIDKTKTSTSIPIWHRESLEPIQVTLPKILKFLWPYPR